MASDKAGGWKKMQMHIQRFSMRPDPSWATAWFTSAQIGEWNWERISNPEYDQLHEKALAESDPPKRSAMYVRMQDLMEQSGAYVFLTHGVNALLHRNHLKPVFSPDGNRMMLRRVPARLTARCPQARRRRGAGRPSAGSCGTPSAPSAPAW